jgi:hypothetical protein
LAGNARIAVYARRHERRIRFPAIGAVEDLAAAVGAEVREVGVEKLGAGRVDRRADPAQRIGRQQVVVIEFDEIIAGAVLAGEALQRAHTEARDPIGRGNDPYLRVAANPVGNRRGAVGDQHPFPVAVLLSQQRLEGLDDEIGAMGRCEDAESHERYGGRQRIEGQEPPSR